MKEIVNILNGVKGCQFANLTYVTDGGIPKKVIDGMVTKLVQTTCQLNYSYESAVNNRLEKQGGERVFKALSLPWGEWVVGFENKLILHKETLYMRYYNVENSNTTSVWFVDGRIATDEELAKIKAYLMTKSKAVSKRQAEAGLTEHQVSPKVVKLENIIRLSTNNKVYTKKHSVYETTTR